MKISIIILALAFVHVGRGEDCKSLKPGDRYCLDETTSRTCLENGEYKDDACPAPSKCKQSPTEKNTLCREIRRTVTSVAVGSTGADTAEPQPSQPSQSSASKTESAPVPSKEEGKQADQGAPAVVTAEKPETCTADINGKQETLKPGDRYCVDDKKHRVCNYGDWVEDVCPENSKCLKSPTMWQVLCRQIIRNTNTQTRPTDVQNSEPQPPVNPDQKPTQTKTESQPQPQTPTQTQPESKPDTPTQPKQTKPQTEPATPDVTTCAGGMKVGDRVCTGDNTFKLCDNDGKVIDDKCPENSQCKQSPTAPGIVCRQFITQPPMPHSPARR